MTHNILDNNMLSDRKVVKCVHAPRAPAIGRIARVRRYQRPDAPFPYRSVQGARGKDAKLLEGVCISRS